MKQDHPVVEIAGGNPWYLDSQFHAQLRTEGRRRVIEERWRVYAAMIERWRLRTRAHRRWSILDAGCGDGINLVGLSDLSAQRGWSLRLIGVDYNWLRLERARQATPHVSLEQASLYALPFAANTFDIIVCTHVLEHVPDVDRALEEVRRTLVPNGLLIVGVPNEGCVLARVRNTVLQPRIRSTTDHVHFFTENTLTRRLGDVGFEVVDVARETFFFPISYMNVMLAEVRIGHAIMNGLRRLLPSQAGGLIVAATRP